VALLKGSMLSLLLLLLFGCMAALYLTLLTCTLSLSSGYSFRKRPMSTSAGP
jgi:hypothetical protein